MGQLHHVGIAVANIDTYLSRSVWKLVGQVVTDPIQRARLCMVGVSADAVPMIELIEPMDELSPTWRAVQQGGGLNHICLTVPTMEQGDDFVRQQRGLAVTHWQPAILFGGRAIRFVYSRNRELLELLADETIG